MNTIIPVTDIVPEKELRIDQSIPVTDEELMWVMHCQIDTDVEEEFRPEVVALVALSLWALPPSYRRDLLVRCGVPKRLAAIREPLWTALSDELGGLLVLEHTPETETLIKALLSKRKGKLDA